MPGSFPVGGKAQSPGDRAGGLTAGRNDPGITGVYGFYCQLGGSILQKGSDLFCPQFLGFLYLFRRIRAVYQDGTGITFMVLDEAPGVLHGLPSLQQSPGIQFIGRIFLGLVPGDLLQGRPGTASRQEKSLSWNGAFRDFCIAI